MGRDDTAHDRSALFDPDPWPRAPIPVVQFLSCSESSADGLPGFCLPALRYKSANRLRVGMGLASGGDSGPGSGDRRVLSSGAGKIHWNLGAGDTVAFG